MADLASGSRSVCIRQKGGAVMFGKDFQRKYALTDQGIKNTKQGTIFTVIVNLVSWAEWAFCISS